MKVAWFEREPPDAAKVALKYRGFKTSFCSQAELDQRPYLEGLGAVVFTQDPAKPLRVAQALERNVVQLLDFDCLVVVRPGSIELSEKPEILKNAVRKLGLAAAGLFYPAAEIPSRPFIVFFGTTVDWNTIANSIAYSAAGPPPNFALDIRTRDIQPLTEPSVLLIRRAFWNCAVVHLTRMDEVGRSSAGVFRAYAELTGGEQGRWPQPYFVKIGDRSKIMAEYQAYKDRVDPYIPFHLGPHLIQDRCALGATHGIIVGDYVDESESLRDAAYQGRAVAAISCLFDRTLLGWHRSTRRENVSIARKLEALFPPRIDAQRFERARQLGATRDIGALRSLFERCNAYGVIVGLAHGDLHAANVRVRATDAIVIDFLAHRDLPLLFDAACLEVSLLVEGFTRDNRPLEDWLASVRPLYEHPIVEAEFHANPADPSFWFHSCVKQIRLYASQWECAENQYAAVLAAALLRKSSKDPDAGEPEASRRAAAYVLADRVLATTFDRPQGG